MCVRSRLGAGGTACEVGGGSGGGGGKAGDSACSTGDGGRGVGSALRAPPAPCDGGWSGGACAI